MRIGTVALIVRFDGGESPSLIDSISDDREIAALQAALDQGENDPLETVYQMRARQAKEDEEFGDYVEELLSQPFVRPEIQDHGLQWLKSKIRIEEYQRTESDATRVIADYAFKLYMEDRRRTDFVLAGPVAKVRIRIYEVVKGRMQAPTSLPQAA